MLHCPSFDLLRRGAAAALAVLALVLTGCAGVSKGGSAGGKGSSGSATAGPLAGEVRWMHGLFDGTPVQVEAERDGAMRVDVPLAYAFEGDTATPKAPLKAVLDKLALSLYRQPTARVHLGPPGPVARERLAALRSYLANKGVTAQRMLATAPAQSDMLLLRVTPAPTGIDKLDDEELLAPAAARPALKPPPAAVR